MQLSARILTALAVLTLALAYVAGAGLSSSRSASAATGVIDAINVGTCYTTDASVLDEGDCDDGDDNTGDNAGYDLAGRTEAEEAKQIYATYAHDPKTSSEAPRAMLQDSDLLKISIKDTGRDKYTGVIYRVGDATQNAESRVWESSKNVWKDVIGVDSTAKNGSNLTGDTNPHFTLKAADAGAAGVKDNVITSSGEVYFQLSKAENSIRPDAKIVFFGCLVDDDKTECVEDSDIEKLSSNNLELDEDRMNAKKESLAADDVETWFNVTASVPDSKNIVVEYIYYETSNKETITGGLTDCYLDGKIAKSRSDDEKYPKLTSDEMGEIKMDDKGTDDKSDDVPFTDKDGEVCEEEGDALLVEAKSDGDTETVNLVLTESNRFSGQYEGYLRLTDADGDGDQSPEHGDRSNWGRQIKSASDDGVDSTKDNPPVLGVQSGPVKIRYRDTGGTVQELSIMIDTGVPNIVIEEPVHKVSSRDDSPDIIGTFTDGESGLREDAFRVYADNTDDRKDGARVLDIPVDNVTNVDDDRVLEVRENYKGFTEAATFGIVKRDDLYPTEENDILKLGESTDVKEATAESYEDGDKSGEFDTVLRIDFEPGTDDDAPKSAKDRYNNTVDIQAVVLDVAGNIGFSDSDPTGPTFINDLGTKKADRSKDLNVIGWYSRHSYYLDEVDPYFKAGRSITGFFDEDDGKPQFSRSGVRVAFDSNIEPSSVDTDSFIVTLDNKKAATVKEVAVEGDMVYLLLDETLASDATPRVALSENAEIEDLAGNESKSGDDGVKAFDLKDGISPQLTITLSGGSGLGKEGTKEGPSKLTNDKMNVQITSDEKLQGAPIFAVLCKNFGWGETDADRKKNNISKYASDRNGATQTPKITPLDTKEGYVKCGDKNITISETKAYSRPSNTWSYTWTNDAGLSDGELTVVAFARDRSKYEHDSNDKDVYNFSSTTAKFTYDKTFNEAMSVPADNGEVTEPRPFVMLDFKNEGTTVEVTSFKFDGSDLTAELEAIGDNQFVYWPETLAYGRYKAEVEANDGADNEEEFSFDFTARPRRPFVLNLLAGWNAISFPADPYDRELAEVFTNPEIDQVIGWDATEPVTPWRMATKLDGIWTTDDDYATLNDVAGRYGYWVHTNSFTTQEVLLVGKGDRRDSPAPFLTDISTLDGWNFVGVIDADGDQTENNAGESLRNSDSEPMTASDYLRNYTRAYTWDYKGNKWRVLEDNDTMIVGQGVWVYYTSDNHIAP